MVFSRNFPDLSALFGVIGVIFHDPWRRTSWASLWRSWLRKLWLQRPCLMHCCWHCCCSSDPVEVVQTYRGHYLYKLPGLGGIKQYTCMVILRDFPINGALFGLVLLNTFELWCWTQLICVFLHRMLWGSLSQYKVPASFFFRKPWPESFLERRHSYTVYGFTGRRRNGREFPAISPNGFLWIVHGHQNVFADLFASVDLLA